MSSQPDTARNALVHFGPTPDAPTPPHVGLALRLVPPRCRGERYTPDVPVIVAGAYRADGPLIEVSRGSLPSQIVLTLEHADMPGAVMLPLYSPSAEPTAPRGGPYSTLFREQGQFTVDARRFFELPAESGRYTLRATLGKYVSNPVTFDLVR